MAEAAVGAGATVATSAPLAYWASVRRAWRLWRTNLAAFIPVAAAIVAPLLLLGELLDGLLNPAVGTAVAVFSLIGVAGAAFAEGLCAGIADDILHAGHSGDGKRRRPSVWAAVRHLPVLRLTAIAGIVGVTIGLGFAVLVLPGVIAFAWLAVSCTVALIEGCGISGSLRTSVNLVRGHFLAVAALTTTALVPPGVADAIGALLHAAHPPLWITILVEAVIDTAAISMTSALIVVLYGGLCELSAAQPVREPEAAEIPG